jgi:CRISPR-associated endonuclease Cas1
MPAQGTRPPHEWPDDVIAPNGLIVLTGYGIRVNVWHGRLRLEDGYGRQRRSMLVHRATGRLKRLVVIGHTGSISLDAIRWLANIKASYQQIDADGRVLAAYGPTGADRVRLRRAQAKALDAPAGLEIARRLIAEKIEEQASTLTAVAGLRLDPDTPAELAPFRAAAGEARTANELLLVEASAAAAFWSGWSHLPLRFAHRDEARVPMHWRTFGTRSSPLSPGPRLAVNPANALLNYLYAILEGEAAIAARITGLDPGLGILHVDQDYRDSLAADLMEPVRPIVDRYLLQMLTRRTFAATDFFETSTGVCRLTSSLARQLWEIAPEVGLRVGRVAEDVAAWLDGRSAPTRITGRKRQAARPYGRTGTLQPELPSASRATCKWCGTPVAADREICDECLPSWTDWRTGRFIFGGPRSLERMRSEGRDPAHTSDANEKRSAARRHRQAEQAAWDAEHPPADPEAFRREILPRIAEMPIRKLAKQTGLSMRYCALIRRGERVPHPRWWATLALACPQDSPPYDLADDLTGWPR